MAAVLPALPEGYGFTVQTMTEGSHLRQRVTVVRIRELRAYGETYQPGPWWRLGLFGHYQTEPGPTYTRVEPISEHLRTDTDDLADSTLEAAARHLAARFDEYREALKNQGTYPPMPTESETH